MSETIIRPLPVPPDVAIRSALLALANLGAELQTYNEEARTIIATMPRWFGMKKASIQVRVQDYGDNSRMELQIPDRGKAEELLQQISLYVVDGHRAAGDMTMRWAEMQGEQQSLASAAGSQVGKVLRKLKSGDQTPTPTHDSNDTAEVEQLALMKPIADPEVTENDFIVADSKTKEVQIKVNPELFADRSSHLEVCPACSAVVMSGNQFCGNCGRPVTMDAVSVEVNEVTRNSARSSIIFGIMALALNAVPIYLLVIDPLISETPAGGPAIPLANLFLGLVLGVLPSLLLGNEARRMAKTATLYLKFRFNKDQTGRSRADWGRTLGWAAIYISAAWIAFLVARNLM